MAEMEKGPVRFKRWWAIERLGRAIELASKSGDPRDKRVVENAKRLLSAVEDVSRHHSNAYDDEDLDEPFENARGDLPDGASIEDLQDVIQTVCRNLGLDPEEVLKELTGGRPDKSR